MKPITYLCFTLLSILIQFCLMDFINERIQNDDIFIDHIKSVSGNLSSVLKNIKQKPHAPYYRNEPLRLEKKIDERQDIKYSNSSLTLSTYKTSTDFASTVFDLLYDENVSMTDSTFTTETYYNDSEFDNVTEITFFDKKMTPKPIQIPKKAVSKNNCECNLLFNQCDINCCCDSECTEGEHKLFKDCRRESKEQCFNYDRKLQYYCFFQDTCSRELTSNMFDHMFCIEKVNLPDKGLKHVDKFENVDVNKYFKWHTSEEKQGLSNKFTKIKYLYGQPIWLLKNETLNILSMPVTITNGYCSGKKPITFLTNEHIKCYVKMRDLHFLYASEVFTDTNVISPTEFTRNSSNLNCTTLYCINWTVLVCNDYNCIKYNKSLHEPSCSVSHCNNIGVKVEYIFYCNESIITKAKLKRYDKQVPIDIGFISQEIIVTFYMGNDSIEDIVIYSGNPGYIKKSPVIASFFESNHTKHFYNRTHDTYNYLPLPYNQNGKCVVTNITQNVVKFGINTRIKCRLVLEKSYAIQNETDGCLKIQMEVIKLLRLNNNIFISPSGNPNDLSDNKWIRLQKMNKSNIYGEYRSNKSKLQCYNLITRFAYIITYTDIDGVGKKDKKILSAAVEGTTRNITFNMNDLSTVITVDTSFIDVSSPGMRDCARGVFTNSFTQNLFLPLRSDSSKCKHHRLFIYLCTILFLSK